MTEDYLRTLQVGEATVHVMTLAYLRWNAAQDMAVPVEERSERYAAVFEQPSQSVSCCVHIQLPGISLVLDACTPTAFVGTSFEQPGAPLCPDLYAQLAMVGVQPEEITHVVLTHYHFDHVVGTTRQQDGQWMPAFPRARYYLGRADWENADVQEELGQEDSFLHSTLAVLHREGVLELVNGDYELGYGLSLLALPGESPGHQALRLTSHGQTLYCLGDLYHHEIEVEQPGWVTNWADRVTLLRSRERLNRAALAEDALLVAAHISTVGRLRLTDDGPHWEGQM